MNAAIACPWCLKAMKKSSYKRHKQATKCLATGSVITGNRSSCPRCAHFKNNLEALPSILQCKRCSAALEVIKNNFDKQYQGFKSLKDWVTWLSSPIIQLPKKNTIALRSKQSINSSDGTTFHTDKYAKKSNNSIFHSVDKNYNYVDGQQMKSANDQLMCPPAAVGRDINQDQPLSSIHGPNPQLNRYNLRSTNHSERSPTTNNNAQSHHGRVPRGRSSVHSSHANYYNQQGPRKRSFNNSTPMTHFTNNFQSPAKKHFDPSSFVDHHKSQTYFNNRHEGFLRTGIANHAPFTSNGTVQSYHSRSPRSQPHSAVAFNYKDHCQPSNPVDHSRPCQTDFDPNQGHYRRSFGYRAGPPSRESFVHQTQPDDHQRSQHAYFLNRHPNYPIRDLRDVIHENRRIKGGWSRPSMTDSYIDRVQEYHSSNCGQHLTTENYLHISVTNYNSCR